MAVLPSGHRRRGSGIGTEQIPDLERAILLYRHKGRVVYVDSAGLATTPNGDSWSGAYTSLATAATYTVSDDLVLVAPGHSETVATAGAITLADAGMTVIGLGNGTRRPTITVSAVASSVIISAASVTLANILFLSTAAATIVIDVNAADVTLQSLEFRRTSGTVPVVWIDVNGGSANACDRTKILGCLLNSGTNVGATGFIELGEVADQVEIRNCIVYGDFGDACIHNPTGKVLTNLTIADCELVNLQTGDHSIELVSACTGNLIRNIYGNDMTQATGVDPGSCKSFECYHCDTIDVSGILCPVAT